MSSVFRREFRGLFRGATGWVCLILPIFAAGILTTVNNFLSISSDASRMFPVLCDLLVLICPLLAVHFVTYDAAKGNARWLHSLPLSRRSVLLGKYFAALALLGICALYFALFPLLIGIWGTVSYGTVYSALLGWFLIAAAALALSFLVASRLQKRLFAFLVGALICAVLYFLPLMSALIAAVPWTGILFIALLAAVCVLPGILRDVRRSRLPRCEILVFVPIVGASILLYFLAQPFYTKGLPEILDAISLFSRLDGFRNGHLDLSAVVLLISVTALCLALTICLPQPNARGKEKN